MQVKRAVLALFASFPLYGDFAYRVENSNFTISQESQTQDDASYLYNYNRLRFRADYQYEKFFATLIADGVNYYGQEYLESPNFAYEKLQKSDAPFETQSGFREYASGALRAKAYRGYFGYEDANNRVVVGLQNVTMGVGRVWTPTNLFNPRNAYALEPDEIFGVLALSYTRHISETSHLTLVASQKEDESRKYAARYKAYLDFADFAFNGVKSDETTMLGYEFEGNLGESGIELRSEGAYVKSRLKTTLSADEDVEYFQGIVGADYAFVNGVTLVTEVLYSSKSFSREQMIANYDSEIVSNLVGANVYAAFTLSYGFNVYLDGAFVYIDDFDADNSRFVSPSLTYTLNNYNSFALGAMFQEGMDRYYLRWVLSF